MPQPDPYRGCHALILAAGAGTRFEGAKLLASFRGKPLISWSVATALGARVESATVVLGARSPEVREAVEGFADPRLRIAVCESWEDGLSASLRCGLAVLPSDSRAAAIFLGDMPLCSAELADRLLSLVLDGAPAAVPEFAGKPGHPVAVASGLFDRFKALDGDRGARAVLETTPGVVRVPVDDPGCIRDVDTQEDLAALARASDGAD